MEVPEHAAERTSFDAIMHRYGVRSLAELLDTWSAPQVVIAMDAMFWAADKRADQYGRAPADESLRSVRAADVFSRLGFS